MLKALHAGIRREFRLRLRAESHDVGAACRLTGLSPTKLEQLRQGGRIVAYAVPPEPSLRFPAWQLDESGSVLDSVAPLIAEGKRLGYDSIDVHIAVVSPRADGPHETSVADLLGGSKDSEAFQLFRSWGDIGA